MRRINAIAILYAFLMLWLCSCSQTVQKTGEDVAKTPISFAQEPIIFSEEKSPEYNMEKHEFVCKKGEYFGSSVVLDDVLYFESGNYAEDTGAEIKATISQKSKEGIEALYTEERADGGPIEVNELAYSGGCLFWSYRDEDIIAIRMYSLKNKEAQTLTSYPVDTAVVILESDQRFLSWYVVPQEGLPSLYVYDTDESEIRCLSNDIGYDNPYTRAYIQDGITSYIENFGDDERRLIIYDLESNKELQSYILPQEMEQISVQANRNYVVVREGYYGDEFYILDSKSCKFLKIDYSICHGVDPFSWHLLGDNIFINSHGRGGYEDKIVLLSLVDYSVSWIPLENSVIGARATALDRFSAYYTFLNKKNEVVTNVISFTFCE